MASGLGRLGGLGGRRVPAAWERLRGLADDAPALIVAGLVVTALAVGVLAGINPKLAIAAALALGFAGAVIANVTVGLCLFAVISFLDVLSRIGSSTFGFTKIVGLLLVVSWLATISTRKDDGRDFLSAHPLMTYVLALFVAWSTLSFVWAEVPGEALQASFRYLQLLLLFLIVYTAVRERRHAIWVFGAYVAGATVAALFAVASPPEPGQYDVARASGTIGDPNELAAVLVTGVILAGVLWSTLRRSPAARLAALCGLLLCALALLTTLSRGGLLALGFALIAAVFVGGRWRRAAALTLVGAALLAVGYFGAVAPPEARDRITAADGGTGRTDIWQVGWRMVKAHPIKGIGSGNFQISSIHYLVQPGTIRYAEFFVSRPKVAHNVYLQVLAENGLVGLGLFLSLVAFALACSLEAAARFARAGDLDMELVARGLLIAVIGILAADFFISGQFSKQLWLLLGMGPALLGLAATRARRGALGSF